jgi:putative ABC transport system ATP-binding protein
MIAHPEPNPVIPVAFNQLDGANSLENSSIVETIDLWRTYRAGTPQEVHALRGIYLQIMQPCIYAIRGRSGSGKTTLLNCIGGLDNPTSGTVRIFKQDLSKMRENEIVQFRRKQVGFIFQSFGLKPTFSAYENIEIMLRIAGVPTRVCCERTLACLEMVGLTRWRNHRPDELSGGQQQRIAIARALANRPRLVLADEPTGDLDSQTAREILNLFKRIVAEEHVTLILSSHDPLVDQYADQVMHLTDGMQVPTGE